MDDLLDPRLSEYAGSLGPQPDSILEAMHRTAEDQSFPHVGPIVGACLRFIARSIGVERAFEFGSGFGYSAYWVATVLPPDGEIVLTELDEDELQMAESYFERAGFATRARFEVGDALEIVDRYDGPFDYVLIDHQKERYREALRAVTGKLAEGAVVVADNVVSEPVNFDHLHATMTGTSVAMDDRTAGVADYLTMVRDHPEFETIVLPYGSGIALSSYRPDEP